MMKKLLSLLLAMTMLAGMTFAEELPEALTEETVELVEAEETETPEEAGEQPDAETAVTLTAESDANGNTVLKAVCDSAEAFYWQRLDLSIYGGMDEEARESGWETMDADGDTCTVSPAETAYAYRVIAETAVGLLVSDTKTVGAAEADLSGNAGSADGKLSYKITPTETLLDKALYSSFSSSERKTRYHVTASGSYGSGLIWTSSNTKVLQVSYSKSQSATCYLVPKGTGSVTLTATAKDDSNVAARLTIRVYSIGSIAWNRPSSVIAVGETASLVLQLDPMSCYSQFTTLWPFTSKGTGDGEIVLTCNGKDVTEADAKDGCSRSYYVSSSDGYIHVDVKGLAAGKYKWTLAMNNSNGKAVYKVSASVTVTADKTQLAGAHINGFKSGTVNMGGTLSLTGAAEPSSASGCSYLWKSSSEKVARVVYSGSTCTVYPQAEGTATITMTVTQGKIKKSASYKLTVVDPYKPTGFALSVSSLTMQSGASRSVATVLTPSTALADLSVVSSNANVVNAYVSGSNIVVTAKARGSATLTVTAVRGKVKKTAKLKITVTVLNATVKCRALLAYSDYEGSSANYLWAKIKDYSNMESMISKMTGTPYTISTLHNGTSSAILSAIPKAFSGADDDDISLFYFTGHGTTNGSVGLGLTGYNAGTDYVTPTQLRTALDKIPGRKVVIIDCCYAGIAIGKSGDIEAAEDLTDSFISEFSAAGKSNLAASGYWVLCASSMYEESYAISANDKSYGFSRMTAAFLEGCGYNAKTERQYSYLYGDSDGNNVLTFEELAKYTVANTNKFNSSDGGCKTQNVKYYSSGTLNVFGK